MSSFIIVKNNLTSDEISVYDLSLSISMVSISQISFEDDIFGVIYTNIPIHFEFYFIQFNTV